jgi:hypothetical protein
MKPRKTQRKVTLTTITATDIYHLAEQFTRDRPPRKTTRRRKPLYPEALILTLALLQVAQRATYRQLLFGLAPHLFPNQPLPALGTLLYAPTDRYHPPLLPIIYPHLKKAGAPPLVAPVWRANRLMAISPRFLPPAPVAIAPRCASVACSRQATRCPTAPQSLARSVPPASTRPHLSVQRRETLQRLLHRANENPSVHRLESIRVGKLHWLACLLVARILTFVLCCAPHYRRTLEAAVQSPALPTCTAKRCGQGRVSGTLPTLRRRLRGTVPPASRRHMGAARTGADSAPLRGEPRAAGVRAARE